MIKKFKIFVIFAFCLQITMLAFGQGGGKSPVDDVLNAIRSNRVQDIGRYMDNLVPITINNNQSNYSHNQAQLVLNDFFSKNPPKDLRMVNSGAPDASSKFGIASFNTPNGKYSIYILMRQKDNSFVVKEIRINKE